MMADAPGRGPDRTYRLRRARELPAEEWTPVPVSEDGTIVADQPLEHVAACIVVGRLDDGDEIFLRIIYGGMADGTVTTGAVHYSPGSYVTSPGRRESDAGDFGGRTWPGERGDGSTADTDDADDADNDAGPSRVGADASALRLSLPFDVRADQPVTVEAWASVDATLLPVTVLPEIDDDVRTDVALWRDDA